MRLGIRFFWDAEARRHAIEFDLGARKCRVRIEDGKGWRVLLFMAQRQRDSQATAQNDVLAFINERLLEPGKATKDGKGLSRWWEDHVWKRRKDRTPNLRVCQWTSQYHQRTPLGAQELNDFLHEYLPCPSQKHCGIGGDASTPVIFIEPEILAQAQRHTHDAAMPNEKTLHALLEWLAQNLDEGPLAPAEVMEAWTRGFAKTPHSAIQAGQVTKLRHDGILARFSRTYYDADELRKEGFEFVNLTTSQGKERETELLVHDSWRHAPQPLSLTVKNACFRLDPEPVRLRLTRKDALGMIANLAGTHAAGLKVWDDPTYFLSHWTQELGRPPVLHFKDSHFLPYKTSVGVVDRELVEALLYHHGNVEKTCADAPRLLWRRALLGSAQALARTAERLCAGGIAATFVFNTDEGYKLLYQVRSRDVGDGQNLVSTIPKAFHQWDIDNGREVDIATTVLHEIFEELFWGEKTGRPQPPEGGTEWCWYRHTCEPIDWLLNHQDRVKLVWTGTTLCAVRGNYDVGLLFLVEDREFHARYLRNLRPSWEAARVSPVSLGDAEALAALQQRVWAPESLYHFTQAMAYLKNNADL